jgi:D-glycero-D-manno-heptose 1,7-bisphosphate phosphatase
LKPILFLDRDGTLIKDVGYPRDPQRVEPIGGVLEGLLALLVHYQLVVVSNQSGVARGIISTAEAAAVDVRFRFIFAQHGIQFTRVAYCFHGPDDGCSCRKPRPGLLAASRLAIGDSGSRLDVMVGDRQSDVDAGFAAKCYTVGFGSQSLRADRTFVDWKSLTLHLEEYAKYV